MECAEFQAIVAGEREEDLSQAESQGFESHLDGCATCREAVERAEEDLERLGQLADPPLVAASTWTRIDEAVRAQAQQKPGREDPFGPLEGKGGTAVLAPAMPVTIARGAGFAAPRSKPLLAFAACAAAAAITIVFALGRPSDPPIGRVRPPEDGAVVQGEPKLGPGFKKLEKAGPLVVIPEGE